MSTGQRIVVCNMNGQKRTTVVGLMTWARVQHNRHSMDSRFIGVHSVKAHDISEVVKG